MQTEKHNPAVLLCQMLEDCKKNKKEYTNFGISKEHLIELIEIVCNAENTRKEIANLKKELAHKTELCETMEEILTGEPLYGRNT